MTRHAVILLLAVSALAACSESRITAPAPPVDDNAPPRVAAEVVPPPVGTFTQVSAGLEFSCALRTDGRLACFGSNASGQSTPPEGTFLQVSSGKEHSCAVRSDHAVVCWGFNYNGEATAPAGTFTQVSAGSYYSCAVRTDGTIACWGQNDHGQASPPPGTFTAVSAGGPGKSCAIRPDGTVACWGGIPAVPAAPPAGTFTQLSGGPNHSCALATNGTAVCWSVEPSTYGTFTQVSAGLDYSCGIIPDGFVVCWGSNNFAGQATPPLGRRFAQVDAGWWHTCAVTPAGDLACWGSLVIMPPNRPPVAITGGPYTATEGMIVLLSLNGTDPDFDPLSFSWDLGDGTTGTTRPPLGHAYADDGVYTIRLTVSDQHGGVDTKTTTVTVTNVAPTIPSAGGLTGPAAPIRLEAGSASAPISLTFNDPAGARDSYSAEIRCGNGTVLTPTGITSPYTATCVYTAAGTYPVTATVSDEDGGTSAAAQFNSVIVQPPLELFATGAGWFAFQPHDRPKSSKHPLGKAHFTFEAALRAAGGPAPAGSAKFWLQEGGPHWTAVRRSFWIPPTSLDFRSTSLSTLTVTGRRAVLRGTGTVNGMAGYTFRITAVDGEGGAADALRVEIWSAGGALVYDSQEGAPPDAAPTSSLGGGQISILAQ